MFFRLLLESFRRQRRRKLLAGAAILLGTTAVTAMLALATTIGDRIHAELAAYGANIVITPQAESLAVNLGGTDIHPATGNAYLHESDLAKLRTIFWANNITGVSPEFRQAGVMTHAPYMADIKARWVPEPYSAGVTDSVAAEVVGYWFNHPFGTTLTGAPALHPWWKLDGHWPSEQGGKVSGNAFEEEVVVGSAFARRFHLQIGDEILLRVEHTGHVVGIVTTGDQTDNNVLYALDAVKPLFQPMPPSATSVAWSPKLSSVEVSARTRPEDAFARQDPAKLSGKQLELWSCRPYANSIAYQIREAIPGANAEQVRKVEQTEGNILDRISGLMWLVSAAALLAAGFAVSAAMATAILERRVEIGLMRSLGASKSAIAALFLAETGLLAIAAGALGYLLGSALAAWLGARIFADSSAASARIPFLNPVLLPIVLALAFLVAVAGSMPAIRSALQLEPTSVLRADA